MRVSRLCTFAVLTVIVAIPSFVFADYTYQETTQITGGSMLSMMKMAGMFSSQARKIGDPVVSTIYIKDNRMARVSSDSIEIIDLDKETITSIDPAKHTYTVMTFQQMRDAMVRAQQEAQKRQAEHPTSAPANPDANDVKVSFDVKVRKTGAEKQVSGLNSKEAILTMVMNATDQKTQQTGAMAITNDMWLVPEIPGYDQVRDFHKRLAEKMGSVMAGAGLDMSKMLMQNPGADQALADMGKEMQKIDGVPIMQIMRMGTTTNGQPLPAASEAPLPKDASPAMPSAGDVAKQSAASALTSHFGLGGFSHKTTKNEPPPSDQNASQNANTPPPTSAVLMESQTTTTNFSSGAVDSSHFDVPAGYKQVQSQMEKH
jgi:hypothetical protein